MGDYAMRVTESVLRVKIGVTDDRNPLAGLPAPTDRQPIA